MIYTEGKPLFPSPPHENLCHGFLSEMSYSLCLLIISELRCWSESVLQCLFLPVTLSVPCPCILPTPRGQVGRLELQTVWSRKALHWGLLGQGSLWAHGADLPGEDIQSESRGDVRDVSGSNPSILSSLENLHNAHVSLGESHTFFLRAEDELLRIGF